MPRRRTLTAVAMAVMCDALPAQEGHTWLTVHQRDLRRSRAATASVSLSGDGRYVAFASYARLSAEDLDDLADIYVLDRSTMTVTLESASASGRVLNSDCSDPSISADGRYVVFDALLADDPGRTVVDIVLRDRTAKTTRRISLGVDGALSDGWSGQPAVDARAAAVIFASSATNLVRQPDVNSAQPDIYRFDVATGAIERISLDNQGRQHDGGSIMPAVSGDGRYIVFASTADLTGTRPGPGASRNRHPLVYLRDMRTGRTTMVGGAQPPNDSSTMPVISADGRSVAFVSMATNLAPRDRNKSSDVFLYDVETGTVTLVSRAAGGGTANGTSLSPAISADGRFVAFQSDASDLSCARNCRRELEDINLLPDVFVFDRTTGEIACVSIDSQGTWLEESGAPAIDATGAVIAFPSRHPVSPQDLLNDFDLFVRVTPQ
jgi:Tol biopolymer transport system component